MKGLVRVCVLTAAVTAFGAATPAQASGKSDPQQPPQDASGPAPISMALEAGFRIISFQTQPGRLILQVRSATEEQIYVIDTNDGHIVAVIHGEDSK